jgi:hypothetical protein
MLQPIFQPGKLRQCASWNNEGKSVRRAKIASFFRKQNNGGFKLQKPET